MSNKSKSHTSPSLRSINLSIYFSHPLSGHPRRYRENINSQHSKPCSFSVKTAVAALPPRRLTFRFRTSEAVELVTSVESTKFGESPAITIDSSDVLVHLANVVSHTAVLLSTSRIKTGVNDAKIGTSIARTRLRLPWIPELSNANDKNLLILTLTHTTNSTLFKSVPAIISSTTITITRSI
jgi:hypothetical protein